jgi:hypothetical protein
MAAVQLVCKDVSHVLGSAARDIFLLGRQSGRLAAVGPWGLWDPLLCHALLCRLGHHHLRPHTHCVACMLQNIPAPTYGAEQDLLWQAVNRVSCHHAANVQVWSHHHLQSGPSCSLLVPSVLLLLLLRPHGEKTAEAA